MTITMTAEQMADHLGISRATLCRWAIAWHGKVGAGADHGRSLNAVDLLVARAWRQISEADDSYRRDTKFVWTLAERAIRAFPRRYLLISPYGASTHRTAGDAIIAAHACDYAGWRVVDLVPGLSLIETALSRLGDLSEPKAVAA